MSHGDVLTDLGEVGNWEALVDDRRQELVLWMRNNLVELTGAAIYRLHRRWRPIWRKCVGSLREGLSHCGVLPWHSVAEELRRSLVNYYGWQQHGERVTAWRNHDERRTPRRRSLGHIADKWMMRQSGHSVATPSSARSFHHESLSTRYWARIIEPAWIRARGSPAARGDAPKDLFQPTVQWETPFRVPDRALCRALISDFYMATC
jgi:hypothetical protein